MYQYIVSMCDTSVGVNGMRSERHRVLTMTEDCDM